MASVTHEKRSTEESTEQTLVSLPHKKVRFVEKSPEKEPDLDTSVDNILKANLYWSTDDLNTLINNLEECLPKTDSLKYSTLIKKLDWDKVKFGSYTAQDCKDQWSKVMVQLRLHRTLTDLVGDARIWLRSPLKKNSILKRKVIYSDPPKKPWTPFFRYFMEKRVKLGKSHPGATVIEMTKLLSAKFAALNDRKKQKYTDAYDKEYNEYKVKLENFKTENPGYKFGNMKRKQSSREGPLKPKTPVQLFMEEKSKKIAAKSEGRKEAIEQIKQKWHQLREGKRIKWIRRSLLDVQRYDNQLLEYLEKNPGFQPIRSKPVITKKEMALKDKFDGKPETTN